MSQTLPELGGSGLTSFSEDCLESAWQRWIHFSWVRTRARRVGAGRLFGVQNTVTRGHLVEASPSEYRSEWASNGSLGPCSGEPWAPRSLLSCRSTIRGVHQKGATLSLDDVKGPEGPATETCLDLEMECERP